jgi:endonuclease/exonuclease/phosphatase family metal-dependent hydrolase
MPAPPALARRLRVATYNVHRWTGPLGGNRFSPRLAKDVIHEIDADVFALQEVLRPFARHDPLEAVARDKGLHVAFVVTRVHKRGELGNAILSRWPIASIVTLNLTVGRLDRRAALAAEFHGGEGHSLSIVATHLALIDRYRRLQVDTLLDHPRLQGPVVLLGDLNAWRRCSATRALERELPKEHKNLAWPASFPAARPILALDRIYARGARVVQLESHDTSAARRGSDHLPVVALIQLNTP